MFEIHCPRTSGGDLSLENNQDCPSSESAHSYPVYFFQSFLISWCCFHNFLSGDCLLVYGYVLFPYVFPPMTPVVSLSPMLVQEFQDDFLSAQAMLHGSL